MVMPDELDKGVKAETLNAYALWLGLRRLEKMKLSIALNSNKQGWWAFATYPNGKLAMPSGYSDNPAGAIAAVLKMVDRRERDAARS